MAMSLLISAQGIQKRFGATTALREGVLEVSSGRVHALLGENGAGKSTMMKILAGHHRPDAGTLIVDDRWMQNFSHWTTHAATKLGIVAVYQELSLPPHLSVAESLFLGVERQTLPLRRGLIDPRGRGAAARDLLERYNLAEIPPGSIVGTLSLAMQQMVEVAKALARKPRVLLLDEATSSLPDEYVRKLFDIIAELKAQDVAVVFISHRLDEIDQIADEATIFRDGNNVGSMDAPFDRRTLIELMAGRRVEQGAAAVAASVRSSDKPLMSVQGLVLKMGREAIKVEICPGEIIGVAGLEGHGQQEFLLSLFGAHQPMAGAVRVLGSLVRRPNPRKMIRRGVVLVPQNRKTEALHLNLSIQENVALMSLQKLSRMGWVEAHKERSQVRILVDRLAVRRNRLDDLASSLSGGNQQKLVFAKVMLTNPQILLMADPMRGVDVATKLSLFNRIREMADSGKAIVIYSSDTSELAGIASRVLVFYEHHVVAELSAPYITNEALVEAAFHGRGGVSDADIPLAKK